jgi:hypothetical protein
MKPLKVRSVVIVDGKWQGGSFVSAPEAEAAAKKLCLNTSKKWEVMPKADLKLLGQTAPAPATVKKA